MGALWISLWCVAAAPVPTQVDGGLALSQVEDILGFHHGNFARCLDKKGPAARMSWIVSDGGVLEAQLPTSKPAPAGPCLEAQLKAIEFPRSETTWVSHVFSAKDKPLPAEVEPSAGGLTEEQIAALVQTRRADVVACYVAARGEKPRLEGQLTVSLTVGASGTVLARSVESATEGVKASSVGACVVAAMRDWRFPVAADGRPRRLLQPFVLAGSKAFADLHLRPDEPNAVVILAPAAPDAGMGGLSKDALATVIRGHQNEIRFCFEQELQKQPKLMGKVAVQFWVEEDGRVQEATVVETALKNATVEQCMLERIRRWQFPKPLGGGRVSVTFPWIFRPAGVNDED